MRKFKIQADYDIIEGYSTEYYEFEANSYEEAIQMIENGEVDCYDYDCNVSQSEFIEYKLME